MPKAANIAIKEREMQGRQTQETLLTTEQIARYLKVDKFTVYRLVAQKKIPAFRVGNQWRFKREMIDAWLLQNLNLKRKKSH
jgi:excisionase family DNA binding protein